MHRYARYHCMRLLWACCLVAVPPEGEGGLGCCVAYLVSHDLVFRDMGEHRSRSKLGAVFPLYVPFATALDRNTLPTEALLELQSQLRNSACARPNDHQSRGGISNDHPACYFIAIQNPSWSCLLRMPRHHRRHRRHHRHHRSHCHLRCLQLREPGRVMRCSAIYLHLPELP